VGDRSADLQVDWFSPEGPNKTMMKALLTDEKLTREEGFEFAVQISIFIGGMVQSELLHKQGLLNPEFLQTRRSIFRPYLEIPRVRKWWMRTGKQFYAHTEAVDLIDRIIDEIEANQSSRSSIDSAGSRLAQPPPINKPLQWMRSSGAATGRGTIMGFLGIHRVAR
jgi:hypothetical protein